MNSGLILIVDDEPTNLAVLQQILVDHYRLVFARNGAECLLAAKKHQPALILLDIQLPDMDGYTVCRMLKADPATEGVPVIFVSALSEVGDEAAGFESGGVDYIIKPVSPALVHARVRTHLSLVRATILERYVKQLELEQTKTARLSRIHAVLSSTNGAIVRIHEVQELLEEAARIAHVQGGFGATWIATHYSDDSELNVLASQGFEENLAASVLHLTKGATSQELGMLDQALISGKAILCNDVRQEGEHNPIFRDAQRRGYLSIVALPLLNAAKTIGVMVLYAREPGHFDDDEMQLLNELSGDISFALRAIDNEQRARFLSYYDALTCLPNTTLFLDRLGQLIRAASPDRNEVFNIAIDFHRFKQLNDDKGRHVGDQVLIMAAERLITGIAQHCTIARIGADNFVIVGEQGRGEDITALCEQVIALLSAPFVIDAEHLHITPRLGIAIYPADADNAETLFKHAETALKQSKATKQRYSFYSRELTAKIAEKLQLERMLTTALEKKQFVLHFQPKVSLRSGQIIGAEALIRWVHPERGIVQPIDFIPLAEETEQIVPIGEWVIHAVCEQQAAWQRAGLPIVTVAVNLSALQFRKSQVLDTVRTALSEQGLMPGWLELELTESLVMQNAESAEMTMRAFRELGLLLSLDDFGTGYSSLAYLKRFPFHTVKIDKSFVTDITSNAEDAAIASAIVGMAHSLHMEVIAEGVETEEQLKFLIAQGCDQMQGYFFSRAISADDFEIMLRADKRLDIDL